MSANDPPHEGLRESEMSRKRWTLRAEPPVSFFVKLSDALLHSANRDLLEIGTQGKGARRPIVVDRTVYGLYGEKIEAYFEKNKVAYKILPLECDETKKTMEATFSVLKFLEDFKLPRAGEPILAIGGGVLLDIVGFAATLFRRGVPYIRIPTTLLALVDASVGVKTGVNHFGMRNRLGSYYEPVAAYLDRTFLTTLPQKEFSNASGEILKMALVKDYELFRLLEEHGAKLIEEKFQEKGVATEVIYRSIQGMVEELEPNLWEKDMKRLVNFGHSFGPVVEMRALPELSHGEAVALDSLFSCVLSNLRGYMKDEEVRRVFKVARSLGLPTFHRLFGDVPTLEEALAETTRHRDGAQELPIPLAIGRAVFFNDVTSGELKAASEVMQQQYAHRL